LLLLHLPINPPLILLNKFQTDKKPYSDTAKIMPNMTKSLYRFLLLLVNNKEQMQRLQDYAAARIAHHQKLLETAKDHHRILEIQGAIAELRRFETQ
jgi:hypothetical protein